ncbi:Tfp pilus assembly protein FimT/FimU [Uliginosibacterium sp. sgz301328]|uniref:pilus assembly FimT family protein n=1 Tax=Uliginosibacterium sp. sgz301328 TaxID=3243764 RepID=UPI00359DB2B3
MAGRERRRRCRGFSLLELMVVLALIALMMGLVGPSFMKMIDRSTQRYAIASIYEDIRQLPRWAHLLGVPLSLDSVVEPVAIGGEQILSLPQGWQVLFDPPLTVTPDQLCSASTGTVIDAAALILAEFSIQAPDCRVVAE